MARPELASFSANGLLRQASRMMILARPLPPLSISCWISLRLIVLKRTSAGLSILASTGSR
jgi:hypothetical protein